MQTQLKLQSGMHTVAGLSGQSAAAPPAHLEGLAAQDHQPDVAKDNIEPLPHNCDPVAKGPARDLRSAQQQHRQASRQANSLGVRHTHPYTLYEMSLRSTAPLSLMLLTLCNCRLGPQIACAQRCNAGQQAQVRHLKRT